MPKAPEKPKAVGPYAEAGSVVVFDHNYEERDKLFKELAPFTRPALFLLVAVEDGGKHGNFPGGDKNFKLCPVGPAEAGEQARVLTVNALEGHHLYPAQAWLDWRLAYAAWREGNLDVEIALLTQNRSLLSGILERQGFRVVTEEEAKRLGLIQ